MQNIFFPNVAVAIRQANNNVVKTLHVLAAYLESLGVNVFAESFTANHLKDKNINEIPYEEFGKKCNLIIVIGGDGSILNTAPIATEQNLPILGINRGHFGFLTDINPNKLEKIGSILRGEYFEEQRLLLQAKIITKDSQIIMDNVLNDMVLSGKSSTRLIEFSINIDGTRVCDYRADGLIVATPTGSTAYALSGGGPILQPGLDACVIVPMFPHNLTSRPVVISADSKIDIVTSKSNIGPLGLSCDGKEQIILSDNAEINIGRAANKLRLIHPLDYNYFVTLRNKLHWEQR